MSFREYKKDYEKYARELLNELPQQIKEYMESRSIIPNTEAVQAKLKQKALDMAKKKSRKKGPEVEEEKKVEIDEDYIGAYVDSLKEKFI